MPSHLHLAPTQGETYAHRASERSIRVVLADDHALMRRSLRVVLDREEDVRVLAEASDMTAVTRHVQSHLPDVLVLDLGMPKGSRIEAIRCLRELVPSVQIVVLTMEAGSGFAQQALDAGAIGFVFKDFADSELPEAVRSAARGEPYCSRRLASTIASLSDPLGHELAVP
jgi:two-component system, NarL family, response regulator NreC